MKLEEILKTVDHTLLTQGSTWDEIKESMELTEELEELKPIDSESMNMGASPRMSSATGSNTSSGCFSIIALIIVSTALFALL